MSAVGYSLSWCLLSFHNIVADPFSFSNVTACRIANGKYQAEVTHLLEGAITTSCVGDKYSQFTVNNGLITLTTCLDGNSYGKLLF